MPFSRNQDIPEDVRNALPMKAQTLWRSVFNRAIEAGRSESGAARLAWGAVKEAGWTKGEDGKWTGAKREVRIEKVNQEQRIVGGWAYMTRDKNGDQVVDHSGDIIPDIYDLEKAAFEYMKSRRAVGDMHQRMGVGTIVEMKAFTPEFKEALELPDDVKIPEGLWVSMHVHDDESWADVKSGKLKMFSVGIRAMVESLNEQAEA